MLRAMFHPTQPPNDALMRISDFERRQYAEERSDSDRRSDATTISGGATRLLALNPSLLQDLQRFDAGQRAGAGLDLLEVLAAALRHGRALLVHLQLDWRVLPLTVLPDERAVLCPLPVAQLLALRLPELRVLRVEPAAAAPPAGAAGLAAGRGGAGGDGDGDADAETEPQRGPLALLLWELALRGAREALLPEIGGVAAYRVVPGADLRALALSGSLAAAVARLRQQTTPLRQLATWPGFDTSRATRLLNALYLQSALMVTRTHPDAIG